MVPQTWGVGRQKETRQLSYNRPLMTISSSECGDFVFAQFFWWEFTTNVHFNEKHVQTSTVEKLLHCYFSAFIMYIPVKHSIIVKELYNTLSQYEHLSFIVFHHTGMKQLTNQSLGSHCGATI